MWSARHFLFGVVVAALVAGGCAHDDAGGGLATVAPLPSLGETTPAPTLAPVSSVAPDTIAAPDTTGGTEVATTVPVATLPPGAGGLSADGPWRLVDSAPGITTPGLVYELMPKLWAFIQVEETDQSTYAWTLNESDRPIIEAYLQAQLTYFTAATSDPLDLDQPGWQEFYAEGGSSRFAGLKQRREDGQTADMGLGVVLLPQVLGDERSDRVAVVADCFLDGGVFRLADGSMAPGSAPGVAETPWVARLELIGTRWKVLAEGSSVGVCS